MNRLITIVAIVGWILYGLSVLGSQSSESDAQAEIARLSKTAAAVGADRDALEVELERLKEANRDLQHVQKQIAAATQELKHLEYLRARVSGEIDLLRPNPAEGPARAATPEEQVSLQVRRASPAEASLPLSMEEIGEAQQALTLLGYGPLEADGMIGPDTLRAIVAFQQAQELPVTGELDGETLRALRHSRTAIRP